MQLPLKKKRKKKKTNNEFTRRNQYRGRPPLKHGRYSIVTFGGNGYPRLD